jgi:hypothetical protein
MVCKSTTESWYASAIVKAALRVDFDGAVILQVEGFSPVIREYLGARSAWFQYEN